MTPADSAAASRDDGAVASPSVRRAARGRWIVWWVIASCLTTVAAFLVGGMLHSPWDAATSNADRTPTVTAAVENRHFVDDAPTAIGSVIAGDTRRVVVTPADDGVAIVTATPRAPGDVVSSGDALIEVSGRPIIGLDIPFALYRDLAPGDSGTDVSALQQALADLGLYNGSIDGDYGAATASGVRALYTRLGADAPVTSADLRAAVDTARESATEAARSLTDAHRALTRAQSAMAVALSDEDPSNDAEARDTVDDAQADMSAAQETYDSAETQVADAAFAADTPLPRAEITALPAAGATVVQVAPTGTTLTSDTDTDTAGAGSAVHLRSGAPRAVIRVKVADVDSFAVGTAVHVTSTKDSSRSAAGTVIDVGAFTTSSSVGDTPGYDLSIGFSGQGSDALPLEDGEAVSASPAGDDGGQDGVAVPVVALRSEGDSRYVLRVGPEDTAERVDVEVITTADGYALIAGDVDASDRVVVVEGTP